jgi:transposase-like protein
MSDSLAATTCPRCRGTRTVKNGHTLKGRQLMRCHGCGKHFVLEPLLVHYSAEFKALVFAALESGKSQRQLEHELGVRRKTISGWMKARHH